MPDAVLSQVQPFNEHRFDAVMAYMSHRAKRTLDQYELMKLHALIDVLHVLKCGRPVIGGQLEAWPEGPVVHEAYFHVMGWMTRLEATGELPRYFTVGRGPGKKIECTATSAPASDDFSDSEREAMRQAWSIVTPSYKKCKAYLHETSFIARAYNKAKMREPERSKNIQISWDDVIDEYAAENHVAADYVEYLKNSIRL